MALYQPFDLKSILLNDFAGTPEIFSLIMIILAGFFMGKAKLDNTETMAAFVLFGIIFSAYLPAIYVIINIIVGIFIAYSVGKMTR